MDQFEQLHDMYSSILSCSCRYSSIPRSTFIYNELQIHPFCTSSFVRDDRWFQYWTMKFLNGSMDLTPPFYWTDFRKNGLKFFNYVKILCDEFDNSYSEIAFYIYDSKLFPVEQSIEWGELISFDFIDPSVISKQINNTWVPTYASGNTNNWNNLPCDCEQIIYCFKQLGFYCYSSSCTQTNATPYQVIPGLYLGCQLSDFYGSTLECFYSASCVQMLIDQRLYGYENIYLPIDLGNIAALDPKDLINFKPEDPLVSPMFTPFLNQWIYIANYTLYYAQCQPEICTYTIDQELQAIARVNLVIGLIGGLAVLLRLFVPSFIKIIYLIYHLCYQQTRHIPLRWRMIVTYIRDELYRLPSASFVLLNETSQQIRQPASDVTSILTSNDQGKCFFPYKINSFDMFFCLKTDPDLPATCPIEHENGPKINCSEGEYGYEKFEENQIGSRSYELESLPILSIGHHCIRLFYYFSDGNSNGTIRIILEDSQTHQNRTIFTVSSYVANKWHEIRQNFQIFNSISNMFFIFERGSSNAESFYIAIDEITLIDLYCEPISTITTTAITTTPTSPTTTITVTTTPPPSTTTIITAITVTTTTTTDKLTSLTTPVTSTTVTSTTSSTVGNNSSVMLTTTNLSNVNKSTSSVINTINSTLLTTRITTSTTVLSMNSTINIMTSISTTMNRINSTIISSTLSVS
ncbi:unnamed protein product [Rotaria sordida]|uniref:MAM domain-containing protein n=1 Tax=Rotaria sordida TaxID=392033 RepID=A0A814W0S5_9BILA|nr:unnamed protein product [Rotaria sordida]